MNNQINEFKDINGNYDSKKNLLYKHLYLNIFTYDKNWSIKCDVAIEGYYHDILQYDKDDTVRYYVASYTKDKSILKHLSNDTDEGVSYRAKETLKELYNE